jgi:hypothetical protein
MRRFLTWLTHRVEDSPGDDYYCGLHGWVFISEPCSCLKNAQAGVLNQLERSWAGLWKVSPLSCSGRPRSASM